MGNGDEGRRYHLTCLKAHAFGYLFAASHVIGYEVKVKTCQFGIEICTPLCQVQILTNEDGFLKASKHIVFL